MIAAVFSKAWTSAPVSRRGNRPPIAVETPPSEQARTSPTITSDRTSAHHCFRDLQPCTRYPAGRYRGLSISTRYFFAYTDQKKCVSPRHKSTDNPAFLYSGYHMESDRRPYTASPEKKTISTTRPSGLRRGRERYQGSENRSELSRYSYWLRISHELHNGTFSISFFDLCESRVKGF